MLQLVKEQLGTYEEFIVEITNIMRDILGEDYMVQLHKVIKNNSLELDSLIIRKVGNNLAPNIYLKPYYHSYLEGIGLPEIAGRIYEVFQSFPAEGKQEQIKYVFEEMKSKIVYRLISYERNKKLLRTVPHIRYLDLAVTFHCLVHNDIDGIGTIRITNEHMKLWETTVEDLSKLAMENTAKLFPPSIRSMDEVIQGILKEEFEHKGNDLSEVGSDQQQPAHTPDHNRMYVLTNQSGINGAACLLYQHLLENFANQVKTDLYLLPSSIHEIIILPSQKNLDKKELSHMVNEINLTQVAPEEVLSDQVYLYSREKKAILV